MVAVRVKPLVDAPLSAMLVRQWVASPSTEKSSILSTGDVIQFGDLLIQKDFLEG